MYVKQLAWLQTTPEKAKQPRSKTNVMTLPPISGGAHLVETLFEIGPTQIVGMGNMAPISELEIFAWQYNRGLTLDGWETGIVKRLSAEYASEAHRARKADCPAPYTPTRTSFTQAHRERISKAMADWADKLNGKRASQ